MSSSRRVPNQLTFWGCVGKRRIAFVGTIFDVTRKVDVYGAGKSYNIFAGKDGSRGLGKSSLKTEDAVWDYTTLDPSERKVLDDWYSFFEYVRFALLRGRLLTLH